MDSIEAVKKKRKNWKNENVFSKQFELCSGKVLKRNKKTFK